MRQLSDKGRAPNYLGRIKRQVLRIIESEGTKDADRLKGIELYLRHFGGDLKADRSARLLEEQLKAARMRVRAAVLKVEGASSQRGGEEEEEGGTTGGEKVVEKVEEEERE